MSDHKPLDHTDIKRFYEDRYYRNADVPAGVSRYNSRLAQRLDIREGMEVLDVACGTGRWLIAAQRAGAKPAGIDLSLSLIHISEPTRQLASSRMPSSA